MQSQGGIHTRVFGDFQHLLPFRLPGGIHQDRLHLAGAALQNTRQLAGQPSVSQMRMYII